MMIMIIIHWYLWWKPPLCCIECKYSDLRINGGNRRHSAWN